MTEIILAEIEEERLIKLNMNIANKAKRRSKRRMFAIWRLYWELNVPSYEIAEGMGGRQKNPKVQDTIGRCFKYLCSHNDSCYFQHVFRERRCLNDQHNSS